MTSESNDSSSTSPTFSHSPSQSLRPTKPRGFSIMQPRGPKDYYDRKKIRNVSSAQDESLRSFSVSSSNVVSKKLKKHVEEELKYSNEVIKINSKGTPQSRNIAISCTSFYCLDQSEVKRKVDLSSINRISLSPHWDNVFCIHVDEDFDFLLVSPDKTEIIKAIEEVKKEKNPQSSLDVCITESFFFKSLPNQDRQIIFECPDINGSEKLRVGARVFVDIFDSSGSSISKVKGRPKTLDLEKEILTKGEYDDSSDEEENVSSSSSSTSSLKEAGSHSPSAKKKSGSTLINKMMKIIPFKEGNGGTPRNSVLNFGKEEEEQNYVFFKWLCNPSNLSKGRRVDSWQIQGNRDYLEDAICVEYNLKMGADLLVGCFDGHGGSQTSDWLAGNMKYMVERNHKGRDLKTCLSACFEECNKNILNDKSNSSGSTALVAVFEGNKITVANTGDCRALIIRKNGTERLTSDHRLKNPEELERVKKLGAKVKDNRLLMPNGSSINLTRSIGDRKFQPYIIAKPDLIEYQIQPEDDFMVIACDGLWETMSDDLARTVTLNTRDPKRLCSLAYAMGSRDNLTAIIVHLKDHPPLQANQ